MKKLLQSIVLMGLIVCTVMTSLTTVFATSDTNLLGDVNVDGKVSVRDATAIQKHIARIITFSDNQLSIADVNGDNKINISDATCIQKFVANLMDNLPGETAIPNETTPDEITTTPSVPVTSSDEFATDPTEDMTKETIPVTEIETSIPSASETTIGTSVGSTDPTESITQTSPIEDETVIPTTPDRTDFGPADTVDGDVVTAEMLWHIEKEFYRLVNEERMSLGLKPLVYNKHLDNVTQIRSLDLTVSFSHSRPNGDSCFSLIDDNKYASKLLGENIGGFYHYTTSSTFVGTKFTGSKEQLDNAAKIAFGMFKNSPGHYANMINENFEDTGIGISYVWDNKYNLPCFYLAHMFGTEFK